MCTCDLSDIFFVLFCFVFFCFFSFFLRRYTVRATQGDYHGNVAVIDLFDDDGIFPSFSFYFFY